MDFVLNLSILVFRKYKSEYTSDNTNVVYVGGDRRPDKDNMENAENGLPDCCRPK